MSITLDPRTRVVGNSPDGIEGRLGLLLRDEEFEQAIVAVTAAQIAGRSPELCVDGVIVARRSESRQNYALSGTRRRADTMLWTLVLERNLKLSETQIVDARGSRIVSPSIARNIYRFLGERVLLHNTRERPRIGRLCSTSARFQMPAPETGEPTVFLDALELESLDHLPLTVKGDSGTVVTTTSGEVLGIVVCGIGHTSYAAPLANYIDGEANLTTLTPQIIREHNEGVDSWMLARPTPARSREETPSLDYDEYELRIQKRDMEAALDFSKKFF